MNTLIPFTQLTKTIKTQPFLSNMSVVIDENNTMQGFVFGRDAFISFLEHIDSEFEKSVTDNKKAYNNIAGKMIDLIEEHLEVNPDFISELKTSFAKTRQSDWIPFEEVVRSVHV